MVLTVRKRSNNNNTRVSDQIQVGTKPLTDVADFEEELFERDQKNPNAITLGRNKLRTWYLLKMSRHARYMFKNKATHCYASVSTLLSKTSETVIATMYIYLSTN
ncbi:hypothetical protein [Lysinibacillus sp. NPDC047702]|uniref:hypothetical protein n=1 Tax=unclassified Lysinibacillus TaxID=2636778 RepID=UPI003D08F199